MPWQNAMLCYAMTHAMTKNKKDMSLQKHMKQCEHTGDVFYWKGIQWAQQNTASH